MKLAILTLLIATTGMVGCVTNTNLPKPDNQQTSEFKNQIALEYLKAGNVDASKVALDDALAKDPNNAQANMTMGLTLQLVGTAQSVKEADKYFVRAVQLDPKDAQIRNNYGQYLFKLGKHKQAVEQFKVSANTIGYNNRDGALNNLGQAYYILAMQPVPKDFDYEDETNPNHPDTLLTLAKNSFLQSLQVNPRNTSSLYNFSEISYMQGDFDEATQAFNDYVKIIGKPNLNAQALWLGVRVNHIQSNTIAMREYAEELKVKFPKSNEYKRYLQQKNDASVWAK